MQIATQRLYLTADNKRLVAEGNGKAATLYATPGDQIPDSAADRFGLVNGALPGAKGAGDGGGAKERKPGEDKERKPGEDKGGQGGGQKDAKAPALTDIRGIGAATAKKLVAAGVADVAALAALDPAAPPAIEGLPPVFDWAAIVELAKTANAPAEPVQA